MPDISLIQGVSMPSFTGRKKKDESFKPEIQDGYAYFEIDGSDEIDLSFDDEPYYCWGNRGINQMRVWLPVMK